MIHVDDMFQNYFDGCVLYKSGYVVCHFAYWLDVNETSIFGNDVVEYL